MVVHTHQARDLHVGLAWNLRVHMPIYGMCLVWSPMVNLCMNVAEACVYYVVCTL